MLNINIKIKVNAELEVRVGRKNTVLNKSFPLILLFKTEARINDSIVWEGTTIILYFNVFLKAILVAWSVTILYKFCHFI